MFPFCQENPVSPLLFSCSHTHANTFSFPLSYARTHKHTHEHGSAVLARSPSLSLSFTTVYPRQDFLFANPVEIETAAPLHYTKTDPFLHGTRFALFLATDLPHLSPQVPIPTVVSTDDHRSAPSRFTYWILDAYDKSSHWYAQASTFD